MLYDSLCSFENLYQAFIKARKGKRHKPAVAAFERNLEDELLQLQEELSGRSYRPGPYRSFYRTEAKRRLISAAPFRDRVVHHAMVQVIEPLFERLFIFDSYANRLGKGTHRALDRCTEFLRASKYSLQCDIRQFFPSVDHAILSRELQRVVRDESVLWLCGQIMGTGVGVLDEEYEMAWFAGDDLLAACRLRGLPIGNQTSQFWANVMLNPLDNFIKRQLKCRRYLRYVDDLLLFADSKPQLHEWLMEIRGFLGSLRMTLHENACPVRPSAEGLPFLGFIVYPDHRRMNPRRGIAYRRRLFDLVEEYRRGSIPLDRLNSSVQGWAAHAAHGDTWGLRRSVFGNISL